ncbi:hypothetical protein [Sporosarcina sp. ACRSL]|uniref:hypothetical protein n=1 Tax=Sporosarcina sp. ACRSL TaxID=2918215 RepID=UPI001EF43C0A|nr:hypothetical protein [Sporosarcina sp. ACRSL]
MPTVVGGIAAGCLVVMLFRVIDKMQFLEKELSNKTSSILDLLALFSIVLAFYLFEI